MDIIKEKSSVLQIIRQNLIGEKNLSVRGLARLCGIQHTSIIRDGAFNNKSIAQSLIQNGFDAGALVENGFDAQATWLVIEYFAYESKAKAISAKRLARTFGAMGVYQLFDELGGRSQYRIPQTYSEALLEAGRLAAENEQLQKENEQLSEAVDELFNYSSIIRIAKFNNCSEKEFSWRKLKSLSKAMNVEIKKVPCPRFETKNLYSHDVWRFAYPNYKLPETTTLVIKK